MKKEFIFILLVLMLVLSGCSSSSQKVEREANNEPQEESIVPTDTEHQKESIAPTDTVTNNDNNSFSEGIESDENENKILIVYFTRADNVKQDENLDAVSSASINNDGNNITGNMKIMADYIKKEVGGDLFSIKTKELYSQDYDTTTDQAKKEQNDDARPELISKVENIEDYDIIFLGYPNWWGTIPMPVYTFLESYDFKGKTIIPFCSHEGSGLGSGVVDIKELCPDATLLNGLAIRGSKVIESEDEISEWIENLGVQE